MKHYSIKDDVEWAIGGHRTLLQIHGIWVYRKDHLWLNITMNIRTFCLLFCAFGFVTFPQTSALLKVWGNVTLIGDNIMANLPVTIAGIKLLKLWFKKEVVMNLIERMEIDWYQLRNNNERRVMIKYAKIPRIMLVFGLINPTINCLFYYGSTAFFGITLRASSEKIDIYENYLLPLQTYYFFNVTTPFCYYSLIWTQFFGCLVAGLVYTSFDIIFGLFVLHACAQLNNLAGRIQNLPTRSHSSFVHDLKCSVVQHCRLIDFIDQIESLFSTVLLGLVISFAALFSILGFQLITSLTDDSVNLPIFQASFYLLHMNYFLGLMFVYSWVGEILITKSKAINLAVYFSNWTNLSAKDRALLLIFFVRIQKITCITIGGIVPLSLDSFTQLIKTSIGYVSVLLAVKEQ